MHREKVLSPEVTNDLRLTASQVLRDGRTGYPHDVDKPLQDQGQGQARVGRPVGRGEAREALAVPPNHHIDVRTSLDPCAVYLFVHVGLSKCRLFSKEDDSEAVAYIDVV